MDRTATEAAIKIYLREILNRLEISIGFGPETVLPVRPPLPVIKLDNVRKGFFTDEQVNRVLQHLPDWYAPAIEFAWRTGWRIGEVKSLTWAQIDLKAGTVRLEPGTTKNREGRTFPFAAFPALAKVIKARRKHTDTWQKAHDRIVPWVFWRDGKQLGDHRDVWMRCVFRPS